MMCNRRCRRRVQGSHKIDPSVDAQDIIDAALADPERNIHRWDIDCTVSTTRPAQCCVA